MFECASKIDLILPVAELPDTFVGTSRSHTPTPSEKKNDSSLFINSWTCRVMPHTHPHELLPPF